jgi:hypothetical protein
VHMAGETCGAVCKCVAKGRCEHTEGSQFARAGYERLVSMGATRADAKATIAGWFADRGQHFDAAWVEGAKKDDHEMTTEDNDDTRDDAIDADEAERTMIERNRSAWRKPSVSMRADANAPTDDGEDDDTREDADENTENEAPSRAKMLAVIRESEPAFDDTNASDEYIRGRYEALTEGAERTDSADVIDADDAERGMVELNRSLWQTGAREDANESGDEHAYEDDETREDAIDSDDAYHRMVERNRAACKAPSTRGSRDSYELPSARVSASGSIDFGRT